MSALLSLPLPSPLLVVPLTCMRSVAFFSDSFEEGIEFMTGAEGGEKNSAKGVDCLTRAADRGFAPAQQQLAMVYFTGSVLRRH
jgi:hypothetical protein